MKHVKVLLVLMIAFLAMALSACSGSESNDSSITDTPTYKVSIHVECDGNLVFSRYDVLVYFDGAKLGELVHGDTADYFTDAVEGRHEVEFRSKDDSSISGSVTVEVNSDSEFSYSIHCTSSKVKIEELDTEKSDSSADDQTEEAAFSESSSSSSTNESESSEELVTSKDPEILTAENCPELAAILSTHNESDPAIGPFAAKYKGKIIEFDGCIMYWSNHGSYKTRFDFMLGSGDYNPDAQLGPNFKFDDVNRYDLGLPSSVDGLSVGDNVRIRAEVGQYSADTTLFLLKPISVTPR